MPDIVTPSRASSERNFLAICTRVGIRSIMSCRMEREREKEGYNKTRGEISPRTEWRAGWEAEAF